MWSAPVPVRKGWAAFLVGWLVGRLPVFGQAIRTWKVLGLELPMYGMEEPLTAGDAMLEADGLSHLLRVYNEAVWNNRTARSTTT